MSSRSSLSLPRRTFLAQTSMLTAASTLLPRGMRAQAGAPAGAPDAYAKPKPDIHAVARMPRGNSVDAAVSIEVWARKVRRDRDREERDDIYQTLSTLWWRA